MSYTLSKRVAADLFEEEYIIANLETGLYYSLQGAGIYLLQNLPIADPSEIIKPFLAKFESQQESITQDLEAIWQSLENEGIVQQHDAPTESSSIELPKTYEASSFSRYADMQDLLALDPIHEVEEQGWEKKSEE